MAYLLGIDGEYLLGLDGYYLTDGLDDGELSTLDVNSTIISQYANSPVIRQLINTFDLAANPSARINQFFESLWDVNTAEGYGLDVWGRIVGVDRMLSVEPKNEAGFGEGHYESFGRGPLFSGALKSANYRLDDDQFRTLILMKAAANISKVTVPVVNKLLRQLFPGRGRAFVSDYGRMRMVLTFEFALQPFEKAILTQTGVIPRPAGVELFFQIINPASRAGFAEGNWGTFGHGNFFGGPVNAS